MRAALAGILLVSSVWPTVCFADFRCPASREIVQKGMNQYEVQSRRGEPAAKTVTQPAATQVVTQGQQVVAALPQVEEWTYDFGPREFTRILTFKAGVLESDRTGRYGTRKLDQAPQK